MAMSNNPGKGALFRNDKQGNEKRPDYTGGCNIDGTEYKISAWINEAKGGGKKYMSLHIQPADQQGGQQGQQAAPQQMRRPVPQRTAPQPFGDEQQFKEADIPF